jgi:hypothetical protein
MSDKSFAFIKADFDTLIDAIESQLGWLTTKEANSPNIKAPNGAFFVDALHAL